MTFRSAALFALLSTTALAQTGGTQPGGLDGGASVQDVTTCTTCHDRQSTDEPTLYMPYDGWVSSMMGNAMRDPLFFAAVSVANQDLPGVGSFCIRCHSPQAWVRGHASPPDGGALDFIDLQGVSCESCHRAIGGADGGFLVGNAQLFWDLTGIKAGPYENIDSPAHYGRQSSLNSDSALCGQCHQVTNPLVQWSGGDGGFPLDTTYEEWQQSAFASGPTKKGCPDCHMKTYEGDHYIAQLGVLRTNPKRHTFTGGNVWGLSAIMAANPDLAAQYAEEFAETKRLTEEALRSAAELTLTADDTVDAGAIPKVTVRIRNLTGHKLPTGYADGRRIFLEVTAGGMPVTGYYDADAGVLVDDPRLRVYEAFHGRLGLGRGEHLALHDAVIKDSRIPPAGFVATEATRPVGVAWFGDGDGDGGYRDYDEVTLELPPIPSHAVGELTVQARLLYQSTTKEYVEFLQAENRTDQNGDRLHQIYLATGGAAPVVMAEASKTLQIRSEGAELPEDPANTCASGCCCDHVPASTLAMMLALVMVALRGGRRRST